MEGRVARIVVKLGAGFTLFFLYLPIFVVVIYAFNDSVAQAWPPTGFTTRWFGIGWNDPDMRVGLRNSVVIALVATLISLLLGSAAAFAVHRFRFFGREIDLVPPRAADRSPRHRDGHGAPHGGQHVRARRSRCGRS